MVGSTLPLAIIPVFYCSNSAIAHNLGNTADRSVGPEKVLLRLRGAGYPMDGSPAETQQFSCSVNEGTGMKECSVSDFSQ